MSAVSNTLGTYLSGMRTSITPVLGLREDRVWEIDMLRGVAIFMMVVYHLLWDLQGLAGYDIDVYTGFWHYWQIATASLFLLLVGVSLTLSYHQSLQRHPDQSPFPKILLRAAEVFSWGMVVTLVTYLFDPVWYVRFGILHLIGVSMVFGYFFLRFRWLNLVLGILVMALGWVVPVVGLDIEALSWLGLDATPGTVFDHSPMIPWFGRVLIGIFIGNTLYANGVRQFRLPDLSNWLLVRTLRLMGQNSLLIYLIHQPIMIILLVLLGVVRF
jgi:uncharacterized membrane protein